MAKRNYRQRESGLLVPGNDAVEIPKAEPPKPWYAGKLWPWKGMGRRRCCKGSKCYCDEVKITADSTVTWISHDVEDGVITSVENEAPCVTYYVDSVSGGGSETGSGTEEDPWTNLNTVFSDTCIYHICTHASAPDSCPKVKVLVKGDLDYAISGSISRNYLHSLIIEPWGNDPISIDVAGTGNITAVLSCWGCIWKNVQTTGNGTTGGYGFRNCKSSIFNDCNGSGLSTSSYAYGAGFYDCDNSSFDNCTSEGIGSASVSGGCGFFRCHTSTYNNCVGEGTSAPYSGEGFYDCYYSTFNNTSGTGISTGYKGRGYNQCYSSIFLKCTGIGTGAEGYGFYSCTQSTFDTCDGASTTCGFYVCSSGSSFIDCSATPTGSPCDT